MTMNKNVLFKVDIKVNQKPISVSLECPNCKEEVVIGFQEFCNDVGEVCDWNYSNVMCPTCNRALTIGEVDWD